MKAIRTIIIITGILVAGLAYNTTFAGIEKSDAVAGINVFVSAE